jgi:hypothetical protein
MQIENYLKSAKEQPVTTQGLEDNNLKDIIFIQIPEKFKTEINGFTIDPSITSSCREEQRNRERLS